MTTQYGIVHNNYYYLWHPRKKDGTVMKKTWRTKIWVPWAVADVNSRCVPYDSYEEALTSAQEMFWNEEAHAFMSR